MSGARIEIAASILNADLGALREAVQAAEAAGVDRIHLDIMDGHFVPNLTFGLATVEALRSATKLPFDAHLMILSPGLWATRYVDAGCESVAIHVEAPDQHRATLDAIRDSGGRAGLAIDPETPIESCRLSEKMGEKGHAELVAKRRRSVTSGAGRSDHSGLHGYRHRTRAFGRKSLR